MRGGLRLVPSRWAPVLQRAVLRATAPLVVDIAVMVLSLTWGLLGLLVLFRGANSGARPRPLTSFLAMDHAGNSGLAAGGVLIVIASVAMLWRRRRPVVAFILVLGTTGIFFLANLPMASFDLPALAVTYSLGAYAAGRRGLLAAAAGMVVIGLINGVVQQLPLLNVISAWVQFWVLFLLGRGAGMRRRYLQVLEERGAALQAQREERVLRAVAEERAHASERHAMIARELHDVMSQTLAIVAAQSGGAAGLVRAEPGLAEEALSQISLVTRDALNEVDGLLAWLRAIDKPGSVLGAATVDALDANGDPDRLTALVDVFRQAGLPVELVSTGVSTPLDRELGSIVYRLVQESLANALKHAGLASTLVEIRNAEDAVQVQVTDDGGRGGGTPLDRAGDRAGLGLRGLRERVESRGGYFHAGPAPGGGFRVQAVLPVVAEPACPSAS